MKERSTTEFSTQRKPYYKENNNKFPIWVEQ
jgi:hypothetical protein